MHLTERKHATLDLGVVRFTPEMRKLFDRMGTIRLTIKI